MKLGAAAILFGLFGVVGLAAGLAGLAAPAHAGDEEAGVSSASRTYVVSGEGGAYEVPVHKGYVTLLYFPDKVLRAFASNKEEFEVFPDEEVVAVRARTDRPADGNIAVLTESIRVSVHVYTAEKKDALFQVFFRHQGREEEMRARVAREVERQLADRQAALDREVRRRAERELAAGLLRRLEEIPLRAADRNRENIVLRVPRALWIGSDAYLFFEVQNRSSTRYDVAEVSVMVGQQTVSGEARMSGAPRARLGAVPPGERCAGVVTIPGADRWTGQSLALEVAEAARGRAVRVGEIVLR